MVTVSYEFIILLVGFGFSIGVGLTLLAGVLVAIYRNTKKDENEDDEGGYVMPLSAVLGGGGRGISQADIQAAAAQVAAKYGEPQGPPKTAETGPPQTNAYL